MKLPDIMENNNTIRPHQTKTVAITPGVKFEANGKTYLPSESFSIGRFEKVEELEEELLVFSDKRTSHEVMLQAMKFINEYKPGEAYTLLYNKIDSDRRNVKLNHYMLRLCAAYINYEGEDVRYLSDETIKEKITDWSEEGLDIGPFLLFAVHVFNELLNRYKAPILTTLQEAKKVKEALEEVLDISALTGTSGPATS